jgi:hypothetical protein
MPYCRYERIPNNRPRQPGDIPEGKPVAHRKRVTFPEKQKVLQMLDEAGATPRSVADATGVNIKTIYS